LMFLRRARSRCSIIPILLSGILPSRLSGRSKYLDVQKKATDMCSMSFGAPTDCRTRIATIGCGQPLSCSLITRRASPLFEFRVGWSDKRRNCRASVHLRNVRPSPPPVRRDDAHPPRLGVPAGADRHPEALKEFLPTSTLG